MKEAKDFPDWETIYIIDSGGIRFCVGGYIGIFKKEKGKEAEFNKFNLTPEEVGGIKNSINK